MSDPVLRAAYEEIERLRGEWRTMQGALADAQDEIERLRGAEDWLGMTLETWADHRDRHKQTERERDSLRLELSASHARAEKAERERDEWKEHAEAGWESSGLWKKQATAPDSKSNELIAELEQERDEALARVKKLEEMRDADERYRLDHADRKWIP